MISWPPKLSNVPNLPARTPTAGPCVPSNARPSSSVISRNRHFGRGLPQIRDQQRLPPKLAKDAPNPFDARARLLAAYERPTSESIPTVAIPMTGPIGGFLPYLATVVRELGMCGDGVASPTPTHWRGGSTCVTVSIPADRLKSRIPSAIPRIPYLSSQNHAICRPGRTGRYCLRHRTGHARSH